MTKEQKIDMLVSMLAPLIFEGKNVDIDSAPQITFLSATEVQLDEFPGIQLPVNKEYSDNPLKKLLEEIVNYTCADERKNWEECCIDECLDKNIDIEDTYIPSLSPGHIYHTIHQLQELTENVPDETDYLLYFNNEDFLQFIQHSYDLKECHPSPEEVAIAAFGNINSAIHKFNQTNKQPQ